MRTFLKASGRRSHRHGIFWEVDTGLTFVSQPSRPQTAVNSKAAAVSTATGSWTRTISGQPEGKGSSPPNCLPKPRLPLACLVSGHYVGCADQCSYSCGEACQKQDWTVLQQSTCHLSSKFVIRLSYVEFRLSTRRSGASGHEQTFRSILLQFQPFWQGIQESPTVTVSIGVKVWSDSAYRTEQWPWTPDCFNLWTHRSNFQKQNSCWYGSKQTSIATKENLFFFFFSPQK